MKKNTFCIAILISVRINAQQNKLLFQSSDLFAQIKDTTNITFISTNPFGRYISVKYADGTKEKISKDTLWGIISKGYVYRFYGSRLFGVSNYQSADVIEYKDLTHIFYKNISIPQYRYYYIKTLNSRIVSLRNKALKEE
ncbi:hypothetical protein [Flectobacillus roseus]|uniref:Uncharacterized protein n=1 Tax=Flectobacillus roseus TaxID=502259 RepID=A0ABT6Y452_9BACT|nr:hypothetical protein [Flectobacillus roseus]MDI9858056.1 hypothetical protein [Flectobacillus roseus]